jgi:hypothetical protein
LVVEILEVAINPHLHLEGSLENNLLRRSVSNLVVSNPFRHLVAHLVVNSRHRRSVVSQPFPGNRVHPRLVVDNQ